MAPVSATNGEIQGVVASKGVEYRVKLINLSNVLLLDALDYYVRIVVSLSVSPNLLFYIAVAMCLSAGYLYFVLLLFLL